MRLAGNPFALLLGTGAALAMMLPLGRQAHAAGIDPFLWAAMIALVPGLCVAALSARSCVNWKLKGLWPFGFVAGIFASVIPNSLLLQAIPHIGSGLAGVMFALSPVVTAVLSLVLGVRPPNARLLVAVACGFVGAILVVAGRSGLAQPEAPRWLLFALIVPLSLACGNVFRTAYWPSGATPLQIAVVANLSIVPIFMVLSIWNMNGLNFGPLANHLPLAVAQCLFSSAMIVMFFRLQHIGGPTYLSQIGYVAAAVGLAVGVVWFQEIYPPLVWAGAAALVCSLLISLYAQRRVN